MTEIQNIQINFSLWTKCPKKKIFQAVYYNQGKENSLKEKLEEVEDIWLGVRWDDYYSS